MRVTSGVGSLLCAGVGAVKYDDGFAGHGVEAFTGLGEGALLIFIGLGEGGFEA